jgi:hypothetical protein
MALAEVPLRAGRGTIEQSRPRSYDVQLDEVQFHRVRAADEVHAIQKMRAEIQLPGTAMADPGFFSREKKETGRGLSALSSGMRPSLAR